MADKNLELTAEVVSAFLERNPIAQDALPDLLRSVYRALVGLGEAPQPASLERPSAARVGASIRPDGLVSFLDGKTYSTLKRHLRTHGFTPAEYRERFGLPATYLMTAPEYSKARSALAKQHGLGRHGGPSARKRKPHGKAQLS